MNMDRAGSTGQRGKEKARTLSADSQHLPTLAFGQGSNLHFPGPSFPGYYP
jgi:hypothetical protein